MFPWLYLACSFGTGLGVYPVGDVFCISYEEPNICFLMLDLEGEQLTTPWEVVSHDWYFGKRDT